MKFNSMILFVFLSLLLLAQATYAAQLSDEFIATYPPTNKDTNFMSLNGVSTNDLQKLVLEAFQSDPVFYARVNKVTAYPEFTEYVQDLYLSFLKYFYEARRKDLIKNETANPNTERVVEGHIKSLIFSLQKSIELNLSEPQKENLRNNLLPVFKLKAQKEVLLNQCKYFLN